MEIYDCHSSITVSGGCGRWRLSEKFHSLVSSRKKRNKEVGKEVVEYKEADTEWGGGGN